jgi:4-diphosphocytidyl-2-C-methyl-D-erythritol kinase
MSVLAETARAKINLTLRVLGRRPDGYHELESLVAFADAADTLTLDPRRPPGVSVTGPFACAITGKNLAARALELLAARAPALSLGHVALDKRLPVAAGIGGGSADAAAVLRLVRRANRDRAASVDWHGIALSLGADVPVCLENRAALMTGTGDRLHLLAPLPRVAAVLVNPLTEVPAGKTAQVFGTLAAPRLDAAAPAAGSFDAARFGKLAAAQDVIGLVAASANDLAAPAMRLMPAVGEVLSELAASGAAVAAMSGAGPTGFALFGSADAAAAAARAVAASHRDWWVVATTIG